MTGEVGQGSLPDAIERLSVTAEGVETQEQLGLLRLQGCQQAQGYLLGRPTASSVLHTLIAPGAGAGDDVNHAPVSYGRLSRHPPDGFDQFLDLVKLRGRIA
jgi:hypothetical protein